ncbi:MAG: hypothetical protein AAFV88_10840, partial [Planctomycetota bacterium]
MLFESLQDRQLMAPDMDVLSDALRGDVFGDLQTAVNRQVLQAEAPLVGSQLASNSAASFYSEVDQRLNDLPNDVESPSAMKLALEQSLGDLLAGDVQVVESGDTVAFTIPLGASRVTSVALDLGLGDRSMVDVLLHHHDAVEVALDW